jgi:hypothetical protein
MAGELTEGGQNASATNPSTTRATLSTDRVRTARPSTCHAPTRPARGRGACSHSCLWSDLEDARTEGVRVGHICSEDSADNIAQHPKATSKPSNNAYTAWKPCSAVSSRTKIRELKPCSASALACPLPKHSREPTPTQAHRRRRGSKYLPQRPPSSCSHRRRRPRATVLAISTHQCRR